MYRAEFAGFSGNSAPYCKFPKVGNFNFVLVAFTSLFQAFSILSVKSWRMATFFKDDKKIGTNDTTHIVTIIMAFHARQILYQIRFDCNNMTLISLANYILWTTLASSTSMFLFRGSTVFYLQMAITQVT